ncbi:Coagulation factor XIII B chain, partial [Ophiophagus hannah]
MKKKLKVGYIWNSQKRQRVREDYNLGSLVTGQKCPLPSSGMAFHFLGYTVVVLLLECFTAVAAEDACGPPLRREREQPMEELNEDTYEHGHTISYKCRPGYVKHWFIRLKCNDGVWQQLHPNKNCTGRACGHPGTSHYASFELTHGEDFTFGARVTYKCNEGFLSISFGYMINKCPPIAPPRNMRIIQGDKSQMNEDFLAGDLVIFGCIGNLKIKGSNKITCTADGTWSTPVPECIEITCRADYIENGNILSQKFIYKEDERVRFSCNEGYTHVDRPDALCTEDGWNTKLQCKGEILTLFNDRMTLGNTEVNGSGIHETALFSMISIDLCPEGDAVVKVEFDCVFFPVLKVVAVVVVILNVLYSARGFNFGGGSSSGRRKTWQQLEGGVKVRSGWMDAAGWEMGLLARGQCILLEAAEPGPLGSMLDWSPGLSQELLVLGQEWPRTRPFMPCLDNHGLLELAGGVALVGKGCDYVRIENGRMTEYLEWYKPFPIQEGHTIEFRCDRGFLPANQQTWQRATCFNSRYEPEPKCFKMCDLSLRFDHGHFINHYGFTYILEGNSMIFVCDTGYSPANQQSTITCTKNGWSSAPRCILTAVERTCKKISVSYGYFESQQQSFQINAKAKYNCLDGYTTSKGEAQAETECLTEGWSPLPECISNDILFFLENVKPCPALPIISHGRVTGEPKAVFQHGDLLEVQCEISFALYGSKIIECVDGEWAPLPSCIAEMRIYKTEEEISFKCQEHFLLRGPQKIKCEAGKWRTPPRCLDLRCKPPPEIDNGIRGIGNRTIFLPGEIVEYRCSPGFELSQLNPVRCENLKWSELPVCNDSEKQAFVVPEIE